MKYSTITGLAVVCIGLGALAYTVSAQSAAPCGTTKSKNCPNSHLFRVLNTAATNGTSLVAESTSQTQGTGIHGITHGEGGVGVLAQDLGGVGAAFKAIAANSTEVTIDDRVVVSRQGSPSVLSEWRFVANDVLFGARSNNHVSLMTNDTSRLFVKDTGEVGIGNFSDSNLPTQMLEVAGNIDLTGKVLLKSIGEIGLTSGGDLEININTSTNAIRIANSGLVGVGHGIVPTEQLDVDGNARIRGGIVTGANVGIIQPNPTNILTVQQNSATDPIADAWTVYSSRRWKENVTRIPDAMEKVMRLRGVYFDWKETKQRDIGMIAEEVGAVIPEVVAFEENGVDAASIAYGPLTAVLIEALKSQQTELDSLRREFEILKGRVATAE